jgi:FkbM family methyltransferase
VESNGLDGQIRIVKKAVASRAGTVRMCLLQGHGGHFVDRGSKAGVSDQAIAGYEDVEADTLTGIVGASGLGTDEIALVWADVQGCERDVIESGSPFWARGVPLWAEVEPCSLLRQGTLESFVGAVAEHFDRFIDARELIRTGANAVPRPVREFGQLVQGVTPEQINTDVLLLPPGLKLHR